MVDAARGAEGAKAAAALMVEARRASFIMIRRIKGMVITLLIVLLCCVL